MSEALPTIDSILTDYYIAIQHGMDKLGVRNAKRDIHRLMAQERLDEIGRIKDNSDEAYLGPDWFANENIKDHSAREVPLSYLEKRIAELEREVKGNGGKTE